MPSASNASRTVSRAINGHGVLGVVFGAMLYLLAVTGTLCIWTDEMRRLEQPGVPEMTSIAPEAAARGALQILKAEPATTHLYIHYPTPDMPRALVRTDNRSAYLNPNGTLNEARRTPWTKFLVDLHYYLHLPTTLGLTVVGMAGAIMLGLSLTGFVGHPRLVRDAFRLRRGRDRTATGDLHNRLAVWTAPFHILSALTGAALGLASVLALIVAADQFDGDNARFFAPVFGGEHPVDKRPAPPPNLVAPVAYLRKHVPDAPPSMLIVHDPGTAAQSVAIIGKHPGRLIFGEYYHFDSQGRFEHAVGLADGEAGQQVAASIYSVHFGDWGGTPIKIAYTLCGLVLCVVIASGLTLYFQRRRQQGRAAPFGEAVWAGVVWGVPVSLAASAAGSLAGLEGPALVVLFWAALATRSVLVSALRLRAPMRSRRSKVRPAE